MSTQQAARLCSSSASCCSPFVARQRPGQQRTRCTQPQDRRSSARRQTARSSTGGSDPLLLPPPAQQAFDRRSLLALLAAVPVALPAQQAAAAAAAAPAASGAAGKPPPAPLPVPALTETFKSGEGFAFDYPPGWVTAYDRSGSTGNGAVITVGDYRSLITVTVFRTETITEEVKRAGLTEETGYSICVEPPQRQDSTVRFELVRSGLAAPGDAAATDGGAVPAAASGGSVAAYDFEFFIESCVGEIEEGLGGTLRCLGPFNNIIPTRRQRQIGRCVLVNGKAYSLNASSPEERWGQVGPILRAVVGTFRAA